MSTQREPSLDDASSLDPARPENPPTPSDHVRTWIHWFGIGRLVTAALSVAVICVGGYWLVRSPLPATESSLPTAGVEPAVTVVSTVPLGSVPAPSAADEWPTDDVSVPIVVHVVGGVVSPGVYELSPGSRVGDAVEAAGGPLPDADVNALNLAASIGDGARVRVPIVGAEAGLDVSVDPGDLVTGGAPVVDGSSDSGARSGVEASRVVDVNRATAAELMTLPGVGPATAEAIIAERATGGPFATVSDLERVTGIGPAKLAALDGLVTT